MNANIMHQLAQDRVSELRREAERRRRNMELSPQRRITLVPRRLMAKAARRIATA
jgi:hypothetical protein